MCQNGIKKLARRKVMNKRYNIFLCYRDSGALFAKNFKLYADEITNDINEDRNFGGIWYTRR